MITDKNVSLKNSPFDIYIMFIVLIHKAPKRDMSFVFRPLNKGSTNLGST